ncbi:NACHT domain-containing protein [Neptunicella marina]|uniref:Uncharacterized protein n=1 Tax=Neptunicella marina TaxID=2125989 RepID=A0A8J6IVV6_9ALTE|nr:hypothetical protein [Neptunicella marina]MBC3766817.1 hypothetical protein [Neptunicella marina]
MGNYIQLNRTFSPVPNNKNSEYEENWSSFLGSSKHTEWCDVLKEFRCVILAEAGAGKTEELKQQALKLKAQGLPSFFIRIEDIDSDFENAFEVGSQEQFKQWLDNYDEAWFFLDSVDEARLNSPSAFKKAIDKFSKSITNAKHRAHIFVSSRPYAWRPSEDRKLMDDKLFLPKPAESNHELSDSDSNNDNSSLQVLTLRPLDSERIEQYCNARGIENVEILLYEINRLNLWSLAERPFDLESIIDKWKEDNALGSRLELLKHNINVKLTDQHSADRADTQTLTLEKAQHGARRLAASVVLTGHAGILIPGTTTSTKSISASEILNDWAPKDVRALLELGIFNDIVYDTVRFRHREIRELLAAEWFDSLLKAGADKNSIKALFFREQYGELVIAPTLRTVLSWLILFDNDFYQQAISIAPEIAVEGGDPAVLPLPTREQLLNDIVENIVSDEYNRGARDNTAIARIAAPDLTQKAIELINNYVDNDDAIFFLGRLAWQGKMIDSLHLFETIVLNGQRDIYARRASLRAIVSSGEQDYCTKILVSLNKIEKNFEHQLLSEFLDELPPTIVNAQQLLISINKLTLDTGKSDLYSVRRSLTEFIKKLSAKSSIEVFDCLLDGFVRLLNQEPFENARYCKLSKRYSWLTSSTALILEKIIEARCELALSQNAISILLSIPHLNSWRSAEYDDYKDNLQDLIPKWPELNDALYWASIKQTRTTLENKNMRLVDDWEIYCHGCFWLFDENSYKRLLNSLPTIEFTDDQLVVLSTVIRLYQQTGKPLRILNNLKTAVEGNSTLTSSLQASLGPRVLKKSDSQVRLEKSKKKHEIIELQKKEQRLEWIKSLRANPTRINNASGLKTGQLTNDVWWLYLEIEGDDFYQSRVRGAQWQDLIPEFGNEVAKEYKTAVQNFWRNFDVELQSEHTEYNNTIPAALNVAMAGLEIESRESPTFPHNLSPSELKQALRFLAKELNGFPSWLESLFKAYSAETIEAIKIEILWELEHTTSDQNIHYVLHDILYYAPWIHNAIAPIIFDWLIANPEKISKFPNYCVQIMVGGNLEQEHLVKLVKGEIHRSQSAKIKAQWFALWVDYQAEEAIPALDEWLENLSGDEAKINTELFVTHLVGNRRGRGRIKGIGTYITPEHLKKLYILAHMYISSDDDLNRAGEGVYTPELRDDAQDARNHLFSLLSGLPGKAAYLALKELVLEHPESRYRPWMAKQAFKRAESDGDIEPWNSGQVLQFEHQQLITPKTHKQLYELGVLRLNSLKTWLEHGNDSPWKTWQRADQENEIRNLVAGWLNQNCREQYTTAQEPELANSQRMDIWLTSNNVNAPVPIELKMLDKNWSGSDLCERLRNQLVGDYLRADGASCGIMLLISAKTNKSWRINNQTISLYQLRGALMNHWNSIAKYYPKVNAIEVIVIDLNLRSKVSDT